jgi:hypothetical protein
MNKESPPNDKDINLQMMFRNIFKSKYAWLLDHATYCSMQRKPIHWPQQVEATETNFD